MPDLPQQLPPLSEEKRRPTLPATLPTSWPVALALLAVVAVELGVVSTVRVSSVNMAPALAPEDRVLVSGLPGLAGLAGLAEPGDVVVYRSPFASFAAFAEGSSESGGDGDHLQIGRVVATGGQTVEMNAAGLFVDGRNVTTLLCDDEDEIDTDEPDCPDPPCPEDLCLLASETLGDRRYYVRPARMFTGLFFGPRTVPDGQVFVLSDNRIDERDSRIYGSIPLDEIVGVASFIYYARDESGIRWDRISRPVS